jgi:hypothetical protein
MPLHSGMIGGVQVAGFRYVVYGSKRGFVSTHRTKRAAFRSLAQDARERMRLSSPSDARVYFWRAAAGAWELVGEEFDVELVEEASKPDAVFEVNVNVRRAEDV